MFMLSNRTVGSYVFESEAKPEMSWEKYWQVVRDGKTETGEQKCPTLMQFIQGDLERSYAILGNLGRS